MEIIKRVTDNRKRTWECFVDRCYYDMYCVRVEGDRNFNSQLSFHFCTVNEAFDFMNLIKTSSLRRCKMTREEFYEKYKDVDFYFKSYWKYTFTYVGEYEGKAVGIGVGGNSDDIYLHDVCVGEPEKIHSLQPYEGTCEDDEFYDF